MRVGFCGLGLMGQPMVARLLAAGHEVYVWNRTADKAQALLTLGAKWVSTPAELAQHCEHVLLCVYDTQAVHDVVFGESGLATVKGALRIVVDHSSIIPEATRDMAERLWEQRQVYWLDAPVSGGTIGAENGTLAIMVGGDELALEIIKPTLHAYASQITHMGANGAGQVTKLCNQTIVATTLNAIAEAISLAQDNGVAAERLNQALKGGWADSVLLQLFVPRMTQGTQDTKASLDTMLKDLNTVASLAQQSHTAMPVSHAAQQQYCRAHRMGIGGSDVAELMQVLDARK